MSDARFGEPLGAESLSGLVVVFKALVVRLGGKVEMSESEFLHASKVLVRIDADPQFLRVEIVEGEPPDVPVFGRET